MLCAARCLLLRLHYFIRFKSEPPPYHKHNVFARCVYGTECLQLPSYKRTLSTVSLCYRNQEGRYYINQQFLLRGCYQQALLEICVCTVSALTRIRDGVERNTRAGTHLLALLDLLQRPQPVGAHFACAQDGVATALPQHQGSGIRPSATL